MNNLNNAIHCQDYVGIGAIVPQPRWGKVQNVDSFLLVSLCESITSDFKKKERLDLTNICQCMVLLLVCADLETDISQQFLHMGCSNQN